MYTALELGRTFIAYADTVYIYFWLNIYCMYFLVRKENKSTAYMLSRDIWNTCAVLLSTGHCHFVIAL